MTVEAFTEIKEALDKVGIAYTDSRHQQYIDNLKSMDMKIQSPQEYARQFEEDSNDWISFLNMSNDLNQAFELYRWEFESFLQNLGKYGKALATALGEDASKVSIKPVCSFSYQKKSQGNFGVAFSENKKAYSHAQQKTLLIPQRKEIRFNK